jgi:hypothetical protein
MDLSVLQMSLASSSSNKGNQDTLVSVSTIVNVDTQKVRPTSMNDMLSYNLWLRNQYATIPIPILQHCSN